MSPSRVAAVACFVVAIVTPAAAADPERGKDIAKRWCATCHIVERGTTSGTDQAPPFAQLARRPNFDQNTLAFLLLMPHPSMPTVSLDRNEVGNLADYIRSLK